MLAFRLQLKKCRGVTLEVALNASGSSQARPCPEAGFCGTVLLAYSDSESSPTAGSGGVASEGVIGLLSGKRPGAGL